MCLAILCPTRNTIIIVSNLIETFYTCVNLNINDFSSHDKQMLNVDTISSEYTFEMVYLTITNKSYGGKTAVPIYYNDVKYS